MVRHETVNGAMPLARTVIDDFMIGRVSSWTAWLGASPCDYRDALIHYDAKTREIAPPKRHWVLGQFSRYLAKGSVVLAVQSSDKQVRAMAARLPDGRVAVVCVNFSGKDKSLKIRLAPGRKWRPQHRTLTDENNNHAETAPADGTLPANSVVTIIYNNSEEAAVPPV
jgi:hypothetical protein